jgi:hypothetical protein
VEFVSSGGFRLRASTTEDFRPASAVSVWDVSRTNHVTPALVTVMAVKITAARASSGRRDLTRRLRNRAALA